MTDRYIVKELNIKNITDQEKAILSKFIQELDKNQSQYDYIVDAQISKNQHNIETEIKKYVKANSKVFFLYDNDKPIGYIAAPPLKIIAGYYNISEIYLSPEYRGKQLGKFLLTETINQLKTKYNARTIGLDAITKNKIATKMYKSLGFKPVTTYYRKEIK